MYRVTAMAAPVAVAVLHHEPGSEVARLEPLTALLAVEGAGLLPLPESLCGRAYIDVGRIADIFAGRFWEARSADAEEALLRLKGAFPCDGGRLCGWTTIYDSAFPARVDFAREHGDGCAMSEPEEDQQE